MGVPERSASPAPLLNSRLRASEAVQPVPQTQQGVSPQHARPCIAHDSPDLLKPVGQVAMHRAFHTGRFLGPKPAPIQPRPGVLHQVLTFRTKDGVDSVVCTAITRNHRLDRLPLAGQSFALKAAGASGISNYIHMASVTQCGWDALIQVKECGWMTKKRRNGRNGAVSRSPG
jgi:hypothetical protein